MEFCDRLPKHGWFRECTIACKRPTANVLVVFVIKKYYYDSYMRPCCRECFNKKISVQQKKNIKLSKLRYSVHTNI